MINIATVGLGGAGENHVRTLSGIRGVKVVRVMDKDAKLARRVAEKYGVPEWTTDLREIVEDDAIGAVTIATPPFLRKSIIEPVAKAGKNILCEKPMALTLGEAVEIKRIVQKAGVKFMVNFGARNLPLFKKIKAMLDSGEYGRPRFIWLKYMLPARKGIFVPPDWFWRMETGGGMLLENGGHLIDFINTIMPPVEEVQAFMSTLEFNRKREGIGVEPDISDLNIVTLRHRGGGVTTLANGCIGNGTWGVNMDISTETHVISIHRTKTLQIEKDGIVVKRSKSKSSWDPIPYGVKRFVEHLKGKDDLVAGFEDGIAAIRVADSALKSSSSKRAVPLK